MQVVAAKLITEKCQVLNVILLLALLNQSEIKGKFAKSASTIYTLHALLMRRNRKKHTKVSAVMNALNKQSQTKASIAYVYLFLALLNQSDAKGNSLILWP